MSEKQPTAVSSLVRKTYVAARGWVRDRVIKSPALDRWLGDPLRKLERRIPLRRILSLETGGSLQCHGFSIRYRPEDAGVVAQLKLYGDYEPETRLVFENILEPGMTYVDGGAHIGYFVLLAARQVGPDGRVIAFEPVASTRGVLAQNVAANGLTERVDIHPEAVAEQRGQVSFVINDQSSVSSKMKMDESDEEQGSLEVIDTIGLDDFFATEGWPRCDLVKLDIEGAELPAFRGMRQLVSKNPNLKLIFEFHHANLSRTHTDPEEMFSVLRELGFSRFFVLHRKPTEVPIPAGIQDLVELSIRQNVNILAEQA